MPWIPELVAPILIEQAHKALSHVGENKLADYIQSYYYFANVRKNITQVVRQCVQCGMGKAANGANRAEPQKIVTEYPFELVTIDLAELPRTTRGNKYIILAIDHFSKWAAARPIRDKTAATIVAEMKYNLLPTFMAMPQRILTDNAGEFQNEQFCELMEKYEIRHETIAPGYPASNGAVERLVGTVKSLL